jgi:hypothetical protein
MASRPGFNRHDTDNHASIEPSSHGTAASDKKSYELNDLSGKDAGIYDVKEDVSDHLPDYDQRSDEFANVKQAETAKDLVTQVIHVDDDPTQSPYTFRLFFLGEPRFLW